MKKIITIFTMVMMFSLTACSNGDETSLNDVNATEEISTEETKIEVNTDEEVDIDLSGMSSNDVYQNIIEIFDNPNNYIGKTIKLTGEYYEGVNPDHNRHQMSIICEDETACCAAGFVMNFKEGYVQSNNYPSLEEEITVIGTFEIDSEISTTMQQHYKLAEVEVL